MCMKITFLRPINKTIHIIVAQEYAIDFQMVHRIAALLQFIEMNHADQRMQLWGTQKACLVVHIADFQKVLIFWHNGFPIRLATSKIQKTVCVCKNGRLFLKLVDEFFLTHPSLWQNAMQMDGFQSLPNLDLGPKT